MLQDLINVKLPDIEKVAKGIETEEVSALLINYLINML